MRNLLWATLLWENIFLLLRIEPKQMRKTVNKASVCAAQGDVS